MQLAWGVNEDIKVHKTAPALKGVYTVGKREKCRFPRKLSEGLEQKSQWGCCPSYKQSFLLPMVLEPGAQKGTDAASEACVSYLSSIPSTLGMLHLKLDHVISSAQRSTGKGTS